MNIQCLVKTQKDNTEPSLQKQEGVTTMYPDSRKGIRDSLDCMGTCRGGRNDRPLWFRQFVEKRWMDMMANNFGKPFRVRAIKQQANSRTTLNGLKARRKGITTADSISQLFILGYSEALRTENTIAAASCMPMVIVPIVHIPDSKCEWSKQISDIRGNALNSIGVEKTAIFGKVGMCDGLEDKGIMSADSDGSNLTVKGIHKTSFPLHIVSQFSSMRERQQESPLTTMQGRNRTVTKQSANNKLPLNRAEVFGLAYGILWSARQRNTKLVHMPIQRAKMRIAESLRSFNYRQPFAKQSSDLFFGRGISLLSHNLIIQLAYHSYQVTERKRVNIPPVEDGKYVVIAHPDTVYDLEGDSNITNVWVNGGAGGKQGQIFDVTFKDLPLGFRLYESSIVPISRASGYGDVYNTWVIGKGYFGTVKVDALPARVIVKEPGSAGAMDPLDQVATVGWKANFAAAILDQNAGVLIQHQTSMFTGTRGGL